MHLIILGKTECYPMATVILSLARDSFSMSYYLSFYIENNILVLREKPRFSRLRKKNLRTHFPLIIKLHIKDNFFYFYISKS